MTPGKAIAAGADYLVVGRPITGAADPKAAAQAIVDEIAAAQTKQREDDMAKGYWIGRVDVNNTEGYKPTPRPIPASSRNSAGALWCAAARSKIRKAPAARATS